MPRSSNDPSYAHSGSSRSSRDASPQTYEYDHKGRKVTYTHRGKVTVVDHNLAVKDSYPTSTSRRDGYYK